LGAVDALDEGIGGAVGAFEAEAPGGLGGSGEGDLRARALAPGALPGGDVTVGDEDLERARLEGPSPDGPGVDPVNSDADGQAAAGLDLPRHYGPTKG